MIRLSWNMRCVNWFPVKFSYCWRNKTLYLIHPGRLTWNLRIHPWKRKIIFQTIIFRFYVNLRGCRVHYINRCAIGWWPAPTSPWRNLKKGMKTQIFVTGCSLAFRQDNHRQDVGFTICLVVGFNPFEKYDIVRSWNTNFLGMKIPKMFELPPIHHLSRTIQNPARWDSPPFEGRAYQGGSSRLRGPKKNKCIDDDPTT